APVREIGLRIVGSRHPDRCTTGLPLIAVRPRLATGLTGLRHHEGAPGFLAGLGVVRGYEAADTEFTARRSHDDLAVGDERHDRGVIALAVVSDLGGPRFLAGLGVERHQRGVSGREVDLVAIESDAATGRV